MSTALAKIEQKQSELKVFLEGRHDELIERCESKPVSAKALVNYAIQQLFEDEKLAQCSPLSVFRSLLKAADVGLEPSGITQHAYLIPYREKQRDGSYQMVCQFMPGWRGFVNLAERNGWNVIAEVVHAADVFDVMLGLDQQIIHRPNYRQKRGEIIAAYAIARSTNGGPNKFEIIDREGLDRIRNSSANGPAWSQWADQMFRKAPIRRLAKFLPHASELQKAVALDTALESGKVQSIAPSVSAPPKPLPAHNPDTGEVAPLDLAREALANGDKNEAIRLGKQLQGEDRARFKNEYNEKFGQRDRDPGEEG